MLEPPITAVTQHFIMQISTTITCVLYTVHQAYHNHSFLAYDKHADFKQDMQITNRHTTPIMYHAYKYYIRIHTQRTCTTIIKHGETDNDNDRLICESDDKLGQQSSGIDDDDVDHCDKQGNLQKGVQRRLCVNDCSIFLNLKQDV